MTRASCLIGCSLAACFAVEAPAAVVFSGIPQVDGRGSLTVAVAFDTAASAAQTPLCALSGTPAPGIGGDHGLIALDVGGGAGLSIVADSAMWQVLPAVVAPGISAIDFSAALGSSRAGHATSAGDATTTSRYVIRY